MPEPAQASQDNPGEVQIPEWASKIEDADLKTHLSKFESPDKLFEVIGIKPQEKIVEKDWREGLPEELKKDAEKIASPADAIRSIQSFRKRESQIRVPGKDSTDEEKSAYLKAVGVPAKPDDYEFPELPEEELTDDIKVSRETWAKRFHGLGIPKTAAKELAKFANEDAQNYLEAQVVADKAFADKQEETLKSEWKNDYDKNKTLANRAFAQIAEKSGLKLSELTKIEMKDGRFLMDRAEVVRMFAAIGREMAEGSLGPTLTDTEMETIDDQIREMRGQIQEAQGAGDSRRANQLYSKVLSLQEKKVGNKPIVGSQGRVA